MSRSGEMGHRMPIPSIIVLTSTSITSANALSWIERESRRGSEKTASREARATEPDVALLMEGRRDESVGDGVERLPVTAADAHATRVNLTDSGCGFVSGLSKSWSRTWEVMAVVSAVWRVTWFSNSVTSIAMAMAMALFG